MVKRRMRWVVIGAAVALGAVVVTRSAGAYQGRVLYLHLRVAPYASAAKDVRYWIDPARGRVRYAETLANSSNGIIKVNGVAVTPMPPQVFYVSLQRQPSGACAVVSTNLLSSNERDDLFSCGALLTLGDVRGLTVQAAVLRKRYGANPTSARGRMRVLLPAGVNLVPLVVDQWNTRFGYEHLVTHTLVLDNATGRPLSDGGYMSGGTTMTTTIVEARDLPRGTLPDDFFDAPALSLPDRAPTLYKWLHENLPWRP